MKKITVVLISILLILSSSLKAAPAKNSKISTEAKGMITGGAATGVGTVVGVTIAGVTAIFPAVLIGTGIGYITVKAGKGLKKLRKKKK